MCHCVAQWVYFYFYKGYKNDACLFISLDLHSNNFNKMIFDWKLAKKTFQKEENGAMPWIHATLVFFNQSQVSFSNPKQIFSMNN